MFNRLQTKFAVLYAALFVGVLALISAAVFIATTQNVEHVVRDQLLESGVTFENLSAIQRSRMQEEAGVLSRDFGFRAAVATKDAPTVRSALDNLAMRSDIDLAFIVDLDGAVTGRIRGGPSLPKSIIDAVQAQEAESGVTAIDGRPYEIVSQPILTPAPAGWVVFARVISPATLHDLTKLSALPLEARVYTAAHGRWTMQGGAETSGLSDLVARSLAANRPGVDKLSGLGGGSLVLTRRLPGFSGGTPAALVLQCPLSEALRPFHALLFAISVIGALSLFLIVAGSWVLARSLTSPIAALESAARRLQRGEAARVTMAGDDELAHLGQTFNAMADEILEREASLSRALAAAEAANQAKSIFLANMNHEVRTPLNGVVGVAEMMASTPLDASQRRMVQIIEDSGAALQRILNDVLDMVDIGSHDLELLVEPFSINDLVGGLADTTAAKATAKGLSFNVSNKLAEVDWAKGDERRVRQILVNLLDNAVKFTDEGHVDLTVSFNVEARLCHFVVTDTGIGFDPSRVEELFTAFNQADGSMTRRAGGTGLGLSLARDIARAMGGDITGEGSPGNGSVFVFTAPLAPCASPKALEPTPDRAPMELSESMAEQKPLRVLLADDHAYNRMVIEMILEGIDTDVVSVEDGRQALDAFEQQNFDVVLMDLQMPVMDGLTAIKHIRAFEERSGAVRTPILVISANVQAAHLRASAQVGADAHLAKPLQPLTLIQALEDHLSDREMPPRADNVVPLYG